MNKYCAHGFVICTTHNISGLEELASMFTTVFHMDYMKQYEFDKLCELYFGQKSGIKYDKNINNNK